MFLICHWVVGGVSLLCGVSFLFIPIGPMNEPHEETNRDQLALARLVVVIVD